MENAKPRDLMLAYAIVQVMLDKELSAKMKEAKIDALKRCRALGNLYANWGIRSDLIDVVMTKKADLIMGAGTLSDIRKASSPPKPHFNGVTWYEDPLSVDEEELILWSHMTLEHRPTEAAYQRYMQLFERVFGVSEDDILRGNLPDELSEVK